MSVIYQLCKKTKNKKQLPVFYQQAAVSTGGNLLAKNNIYQLYILFL